MSIGEGWGFVNVYGMRFGINKNGRLYNRKIGWVFVYLFI